MALSRPDFAFKNRPLRIPDNVQIGRMEPPNMVAGKTGTWRLNLEVNSRVEGDTLQLWLGGHRWLSLNMACQNRDPGSEGYVTCFLDGVSLEPIERGAPSRMGDIMKVAFRVPDGGIPINSRLEMVIGDRSGGGPGIGPPHTAISRTFIPLTIGPRPDSLPKNHFNWLGAFVLEVVGGDLGELRALAPSSVGAGEEFDLLVRPQDKYGNVSPVLPDSIEIDTGEKHLVLDIADKQINPAGVIKVEGISISKPGVHMISVADPEHGIRTESNPLSVGEGHRDLYWGVLHEHTEISDGAGSLDSCYINMRRGSGLDFGATSDHDHRFETTDRMWEMTKDAAARHNDPGRFTAFLGYEWAKWRRNGDGDRNVYYRSDECPFLRSETGEYDTPNKLFDGLQGEQSLVIPHHTAYPGNFCDWSQHDPIKERLVEIYSVFGSSERASDEGNPFPIRTGQAFYPKWVEASGTKPGPSEEPVGFVQNALKKGWRVGFTGGGDMHLGHPGDDVRSGYPPYDYKPGLTGVWAKENTREALWSSLRERQCYATTGCRMILHMSVNGSPMGSEVVQDGNRPRVIEFQARGAGTISSVSLVRNNQVLRLEEPEQKDVDTSWLDEESFDDIALPPTEWCPRPFIFYYIRIQQDDGEMGWTSPVWIDRGD